MLVQVGLDARDLLGPQFVDYVLAHGCSVPPGIFDKILTADRCRCTQALKPSKICLYLRAPASICGSPKRNLLVPGSVLG